MAVSQNLYKFLFFFFFCEEEPTILLQFMHIQRLFRFCTVEVWKVVFGFDFENFVIKNTLRMELFWFRSHYRLKMFRTKYWSRERRFVPFFLYSIYIMMSMMAMINTCSNNESICLSKPHTHTHMYAHIHSYVVSKFRKEFAVVICIRSLANHLYRMINEFWNQCVYHFIIGIYL